MKRNFWLNRIGILLENFVLVFATVFFLKNYMKGRKNPRWKGGKNKSAWRQRVIERDNYTCQKCKINDPGVLTVDHIKNKALHKKNIYDVNNGITLCANCHLIKTKEDRELKAIFKKIAVKTVSNTLAKRYVKL